MVRIRRNRSAFCLYSMHGDQLATGCNPKYPWFSNGVESARSMFFSQTFSTQVPMFFLSNNLDAVHRNGQEQLSFSVDRKIFEVGTFLFCCLRSASSSCLLHSNLANRCSYRVRLRGTTRSSIESHCFDLQLGGTLIHTCGRSLFLAVPTVWGLLTYALARVI